MRFQNKKVSARATALALVFGVVGVLVTALPAWATTPGVTAVAPNTGVRGTAVTVTGTDFQNPAISSVTINGGAATFTVTGTGTLTTSVPCTAATGVGRVIVTNADGASADVAADDFTVTASAAPTITSFAPTGGPAGSIVTITGTNLCNPSAVTFNNIPAVVFTATNATTIVATVPATATTGKVSVTTAAGTATTTTDFTVGAAPTITSFTPTSGPVGKSVTITGTNLTGVTAVKFNGVTATFTPSTATSVTATVPSGATTGKISVTTPIATATSATDFTVTVVTTHNRSVNLELKKHLVASGTVKVSDGFNACRSGVTVKIQHLKNGEWKGVGSDQTSGNGKYKIDLKDKTGKYRAIAKKASLNGGSDICAADTSNTVKHTH